MFFPARTASLSIVLLLTAAGTARATPPSSESAGVQLRYGAGIGIGHGVQSVGAPSGIFAASKDDDTAIGTSGRTGTAGTAPVAANAFDGMIQEVDRIVLKRRSHASGRIAISFEVDRAGKVKKPMVISFDRALDRELEKQLAATVLPRTYAGRQIETTLAYRLGKLMRR